MTGQDLSTALLTRMAGRVLTCGGVLDVAQIADELVAADLNSGALTVEQARSRYTAEQYASGVMRAFAALAGLDAVIDCGDFPPLVTVKAGELLTHADIDSIEEQVVDTLLALPARGPGLLNRSRLDVVRADTLLASQMPGYRDVADDAAGTWQLLADLHDRGLMDVSAAPSRRLVTGVLTTTATVPAGFAAAVSGKARRAAAEIAALTDFFTDRSTCANVKFADYFGVQAPQQCCTSAANRCSACWDYRVEQYPATDVRPPSAAALETANPKPAGARLDPAVKARRLDQQVARLCWQVEPGLYASDLWRALRGQDSWFYVKANRRISLPSAVIGSRYFGANPGVSPDDVDASCQRLQAAGVLIADGPRWRDAGNVARRAARQARQAAQANDTDGTGAPAAAAQQVDA